jgi:hypothetical protein
LERGKEGGGRLERGEEGGGRLEQKNKGGRGSRWLDPKKVEGVSQAGTRSAAPDAMSLQGGCSA